MITFKLGRLGRPVNDNNFAPKVYLKSRGPDCKFCDNFPNFCSIDVFSLEMNSQVYEGHFELFPATKKKI